MILNAFHLVMSAVAMTAAVSAADDVQSGPAIGTPLNQLNVTKIAGPADGVVDGTTLCYR